MTTTIDITEQMLADQAAMQEEILRLRAQLQAKAKPAFKPSLKVSEKGGVSVYGLGRFPVTLYREQWERLLGMTDDIRAFLAANADKLKVKGE